jgi:hypothetical protein
LSQAAERLRTIRRGTDTDAFLAPARQLIDDGAFWRHHDPAFALYQQFLHLGEAGLIANIQVVVVSGFVAPESERNNWGARWAAISM